MAGVAAAAAAASASIFFLNAARAASSRAVASMSCTMSVAEMPRPLIADDEWRDTLESAQGERKARSTPDTTEPKAWLVRALLVVFLTM